MLLVRKGYNPVLALAKVGTWLPNQVFSCEKVAAIVKQASKLTGFEAKRIFPVKNQTNEYSVNTLVQQVPLMAISKAASDENNMEEKKQDDSGVHIVNLSKTVWVRTVDMDPDSFDAFLVKNSLLEMKGTFENLELIALKTSLNWMMKISNRRSFPDPSSKESWS
jgi:hypothetical protein